MQDNRVSIGAILTLIGVLALAQNLRLLSIDSDHIVGLAFLLGGLAFFLQGRKGRNGFKLYGGLAAMFTGFAIIVGTTNILPGEIIGTAILWLIASVFLSVHLNKREAYWPLIPAGILFTIGFAVALEGFRLVHGSTIGAIINFGIAATFGYLYSIRNEQNRLEWAKYPALGMLLVSLIVYFSDRHYGVGPIIFSVALILAGIGLIVQTLRSERRVASNDQTA
jgi:hypothetical protein